MPEFLTAVPTGLLILAGLIGGMCVIGLHGFAGLLATRTIKYKVTGRVVALVLVLAGTAVGTGISYAMTTTAIEIDAGIARCIP